ncbi:MAG: hypothetical protein E6G83_16355 [Alphaproteobacteria bacterium]|nr:MAG: hypothetical protein E6G83_16355 [Alphaproteobacteria bacterium]
MAQTHVDIDSALEAEQQRLTSRKQELETELAEINSRLARITRYFTDEPTPSSRFSPPSPRRGDRHPRGFVQQTVLKTISEHPQGLSRGEIIKLLATEGIGEQSISNSLSALVEARKVLLPQTRGGKYRSAAAEVPTAPDQPSP